MADRQTHTVQYGPPGRYFVREELTRQPVATFTYKVDAIAEAERRNGWPITGSERAYAARAEEAGLQGDPRKWRR